MSDTPETAVEPTEPPAAPSEPESSSPAPVPEPPDTETQLAAEREARIRLEGKVEGLSSAPRQAGPPPQPLPPLTPELVEVAYNRGEITEEQRQRAHARLEAMAVVREDRRRDAEVQSVRSANERLEEIIDQYPDLRDGRSELIAKVREEIEYQLAETPGFNPRDPRHQLLAVRLVVGGHRLGGPRVNDREFQRRRLPAGGAGSGGAAPGGPGSPRQDHLRGIPPETVSYWRSHGWIPDAAAEKKYADRWKAQTAKRRLRVGA